MKREGKCIERCGDGGGMDELLGVLGYKVRSDEMEEVALKLEQLEEVMCNTQHQQTISDLQHYNPSDLNSWLHSILSQFNYIPTTPPSTAIPNKPPAYTSAPTLIDSEENGICLVHTLRACAEAIHDGNTTLADALVSQIAILSSTQAGAMGKVGTYFAEALALKIYAFPTSTPDLISDTLESNFYDACPYLKFAHFTANQAILEAFSNRNTLHVVDFSIKQGMQWPPLMQALALRSHSPLNFRITAIGPPSPDGTDPLQDVGWKLAQFAQTINVNFEYRGLVATSLADIDPNNLNIRPGEALAVNSILQLHRLLAWPGDVDKVLCAVREMDPVIVTVVEQEASHNGPLFLDRFSNCLHYYSTMFDSLEIATAGEERVLSEVYLGRQICNIVACEGSERVERHEPLIQWRERFERGGFDTAHLGSNAFKQARMLLALFAGDGYRVEESDGCLLLGWHMSPLIATSAWRLHNKTRG